MNAFLKLHKVEGIIKAEEKLWKSLEQDYITLEEFREERCILNDKLLIIKLED